MPEFIDSVNEKKKAKKLSRRESLERELSVASFEEVKKAIVGQTEMLLDLLSSGKAELSVNNHPKELSVPELKEVKDSIEKVNLSTISNKIDLSPLESAVNKLHKEVTKLPKDKIDIPKIDKVSVDNLKTLEKELKAVVKAVKSIKIPKVDPKIEVKPADVVVEKTDLKPLEKAIKDVTKAVSSIKMPDPSEPTDISSLVSQLSTANSTLNKILERPMPVPNMGGLRKEDGHGSSASDPTYTLPGSDELSYEEDVALASGASLDSGWLDLELVDKYKFSATMGAASNTLIIDSAPTVARQASPLTTTTTIDSTFHLFNVLPRQRYMRFRWRNDDGSAQDATMSIQATYGSSDKLGVFPLNVDPADFSQAGLVQAVTRALDPDGTYINTPAGGGDAGNSSQTPLTNTSIGTFTVDTGTDVITLTGHGLSDGDKIVVKSDNRLPRGLEEDIDYFIINSTTNTFQVATTATGSAIDIETEGLGTHTAYDPGVFEGTYQDVRGYASGLFFAFGFQPLSDIKLVYSPDGVTERTGLLQESSFTTSVQVISGFYIYLTIVTTFVDKYVKLVATNGSTDQTSGLFEIATWLYDKPYPGTFLAPEAAFSSLTSLLATRALGVGVQPDGDYENLKASGSDTDNSSTTLLPADQIFLGTWKDTTGFVEGMSLIESDQDSAPDSWCIQFTETEPDDLLSDTVTFDTGTDVVSVVAHGLETGDQVYFTTDGTLPTGITENESYYVINANTDDFQISETEGGSAIDLTGTPSGTHTFTQEPFIHRQVIETYEATGSGQPLFFPVTQGEYYRIKYINGTTGQNDFVCRAELLATATGNPKARMDAPSSDTKLAAITKSVIEAKDEDSGVYSNVQQSGGGLKSSIANHDVETPVKSLSSGNTGATNVGSDTAIQIAGTPLTNRRSFALRNNDATLKAYFGFTSSVNQSTGFEVSPLESLELEIDENVQTWVIAEDGGGSTNTQTLSPSGVNTNNGATNPTNALTSNDSRTSLDNQGDNVIYDMTDFSFTGSFDTIQSVVMGFEGRKESGQTQTVTLQETVTNIGSSGTSITTTGSLTASSTGFYIAFISHRTSAETVTSVSGLGLTWEVVTTVANSGNGRTTIYKASGTPTSSGAVTANFSGTVASRAITAQYYSGVNLSSPIGSNGTNTGSGTSWSATAATTTNLGRAIAVATTGVQITSNPGGDDTEHVDQNIGGGAGSRLTQTVISRAATGVSATPDGTWSSSTGWSAIAVSLNPADAVDPLVTLSYDVSGTGGATTLAQTISSTTDASYEVDITGDRAWTDSDLDNTKLTITATTLGAADAQIDHLYLEVTESTDANTIRVSFIELGT